MRTTSLCAVILLSVALLTFTRPSSAAVGDTCSSREDQAVDCGLDFVCLSNNCTYCRPGEEDCVEPLRCYLDDDGLGRCGKTSLFPLKSVDIVASFCAFIGAMMAAGGGLGGGGIFVPIFILIIGMSPKDAVPLSQGMIFGGAIVNVVLYYITPHPTFPDRPVIDYNAVLVLQPLMLLGTVVGVILNLTFPSWLIVVCLAVTLTLASIRTAGKGRRVWNEESHMHRIEASRRRAHAEAVAEAEEHGDDVALVEMHAWENEHPSAGKPRADSADPEHEDIQPVNGNGTGSLKRDLTSDSVASLADPDKPISEMSEVEKQLRVKEIIRRENSPWRSAVWILIVWLVVSVQAVLRGGRAGTESMAGISKCSTAFWLVTAAGVPVLIGVTFIIATGLVKNAERKVALGYVYSKGEIVWNKRNAYLYPFLAAVAGIMGGLLGIGGGMIMGPLLLELGMVGQTTSATSAVTVFLTSSSAAFQFFLADALLVDYSIWFAAIGFVATFFGQTGINYLVKKYKRASLIIISIAGVIILATVLMTAAGIVRLVDDLEEGRSIGFTDYCSV